MSETTALTLTKYIEEMKAIENQIVEMKKQEELADENMKAELEKQIEEKKAQKDDMENIIQPMCVTYAKVAATFEVLDNQKDGHIKSLLPLEDCTAAALTFARDYDLAFDVGAMLEISNKFTTNERVAIGYELGIVTEINDGKYIDCFPKTELKVSELIVLSEIVDKELEKVGVTKEMTYDETKDFAKDQFINMKPLIAENETNKVNDLFKNDNVKSSSQIIAYIESKAIAIAKYNMKGMEDVPMEANGKVEITADEQNLPNISDDVDNTQTAIVEEAMNIKDENDDFDDR